jgi:pimeloyl-ACP methyl ester carboxylesterase
MRLLPMSKYIITPERWHEEPAMVLTPESKFINANNLKLHYLEWGSHNTQIILLLHGIGDNAHIWDRFACTFEGSMRVIALDQRGHGRSEWSLSGAYTCSDYVGDLDGVIKALRLSRFVLLGHSMGALHATRYSSLHSNMVAGLIHADIEPCPPEWNKQYLTNLYNDLPTFYRAIDEYVDQMKYNSPYADQDLLFQIASMALDRNDDGRYRCQYDREVLSRFDRYDITSDLANITCPTLILRGMESRVMRRHIAEEMCRTIPDSRLVEITNANHPVHTDNPQAFQNVIRSFLKEINFTSDDASCRSPVIKTVA